jgi:ELWxxDGT repeat protein
LADSTGTGGFEMWRTDGSRDGTVRFGDVQFGAATEPPGVAHCAHGFAFAIDGETGILDGNTDTVIRENIAADFTEPAPSIWLKPAICLFSNPPLT